MASLPYPRRPPNSFHRTHSKFVCASPPTEFTEFTEVSGEEYSPTDCTDFHRLGGYGIPAIPTQPQNYLPTEFTEHTETTGGEEKSVNSVKSVGGSSTPEASVGSACSVGDSYLKLCWCSGDRCTPWCYCKPFTSSIGKPEP